MGQGSAAAAVVSLSAKVRAAEKYARDARVFIVQDNRGTFVGGFSPCECAPFSICTEKAAMKRSSSTFELSR
jgi:hypothetical protein